jgi:hypothetical protein
MTESIDLFNEIAVLRDEVEEQGSILDALVRASGTAQEILAELSKDKKAVAVLLAVNGVRSQNAIVDHMLASGSKASAATVSRKLALLANNFALIALSHRNQAGKVYHLTRLNRALRISATLSPK